MQVAIDFELTWADFADVVDTACHCIGYWADEVEFAEPYDAEEPEALLSISCEEGVEIYEITKDDVEKAMGKIMENKVEISASIRSDVTSAIKEDDYGYIDSYAADAIIQIACFGEIVYG